MKAKVAEEKRSLDQDIDKTKDEKKIEMEKKMAELEIDNQAKRRRKDLTGADCEQHEGRVQHERQGLSEAVHEQGHGT